MREVAGPSVDFRHDGTDVEIYDGRFRYRYDESHVHLFI